MNPQGTPSSQNILGGKQKNKEFSHFLISKLITKLQSSKQCGIGIKRHIDQWNRIKSPNRHPPTWIWPTDLQQECQDHSLGKDSLFGIWIATCERIKLDPYFIIPYTKFAVVPPYAQGIRSRTPRGCLKPWIVLNPIYAMLLPVYSTYDKAEYIKQAE